MITPESASVGQFGLELGEVLNTKLRHMNPQPTWPSILAKLIAKQDLDRSEANWAMSQIMAGDSSEAEIAAFMLALRSKGETVSELAGLVDVMLKQAVLLDTGDDALDIVGTGGDLVGTVNVSSMASILASAAGVPVMKHGSRSASGKPVPRRCLKFLASSSTFLPNGSQKFSRRLASPSFSRRYFTLPCGMLPPSGSSWVFQRPSTSSDL